MTWEVTMRWPVSVKAVLGWDDRFVVLRNERGQWELPGGRLEHGEQPVQALQREVDEELALQVTVGPLVLAETFEVVPSRWVLILAYRCTTGRPAILSHSDEHDGVMAATASQLTRLPIPDVYRRAIATAATQQTRAGG
jgi:8-oxo-dGTP pyrophosphatase MutT (NUDIX family)